MDELRLEKDGTATLVLDKKRIKLPRPNVRQIGELLDRLVEADEKVNAELGDDDEHPATAAATMKMAYSLDSPYLAVFIDTVRDLTGEELEVETLPAWSAGSTALTALYTHWIEVPLHRGPDQGGGAGNVIKNQKRG